MNEPALPRINKWPFLVSDVILLAAAALITTQTAQPIGLGMAWVCFLCVAVGALLAVAPFYLEYRAAERLAHTSQIQSAVDQIQNLELIGVQINTATAQLHTILEECAKSVSASGSLSDRIIAEAAAFKEFLEKASDSEKSTLRLEVDKMKRSETEWLQVTTGILDHVFALQQAAARSGQPELAHQISLFQRACRDLARRIGLVPFAPEENQPFDPNLHHLADAESGGEKGGPIARILATGYTYQGQLVRRSLVSLTASPGKTASAKPATQEAATQAESSPQTSQSVSVADDLPDLSIAEINAKAQKRPATDSGPTSQDSLLL